MSKTKSFIFKGKQSFSSSKLEQIRREFNKLNNLDAKFHSNEIYLILADSEDFNLEAQRTRDDHIAYTAPYTRYRTRRRAGNIGAKYF